VFSLSEYQSLALLLGGKLGWWFSDDLMKYLQEETGKGIFLRPGSLKSWSGRKFLCCGEKAGGSRGAVDFASHSDETEALPARYFINRTAHCSKFLEEEKY
jgi:hypothetical protein